MSKPPKRIYNVPLIVSLILGTILIWVAIEYIPKLNDQFKIVQNPQVQVSVEPRTANLSIGMNETVSKRLILSFSEPVNLTKLDWEIPPYLDKYLDVKHNSTSKTKEHLVYVLVNNSRSKVPLGEYEGIIRSYYITDEGNNPMNIIIPIDLNVFKKNN